MTISRNLSVLASNVSSSGIISTPLLTTPIVNSATTLSLQTNGSTTAVTIDASQIISLTNALPVTSGGTGNITGATNYTGFKNRIINGAMVIDQRNAGASVSLIAAPFTLDRWAGQVLTGGGVQRITSPIAGFTNSLKYPATASNAFLQMGQQIEYTNCYDLQNTTVAISFWAKANNTNAGSTALVVRTRTGAGVDSIVRFAGTNVDTSVTITTSAVQYTVTRTLPATFGALSLEFALGANVSGDGFEITGVQLEKGSTATSFDYRPYGTELSLCQRYLPAFTNTVSGTYTISNAGGIVTTTTARITIPFQVATRVPPTGLTTTAPSGFFLYNGSQINQSPTAVTLAAPGIYQSEITATFPAISAAGQGQFTCFWFQTLGAQLLFTGCEL